MIRGVSYVELHCHSAFSLLDGASDPESLVRRARALGMPALALTDHDDLGGIVRFAQAAAAAAIEAIVGVELSVECPAPHHLVLLAESREGYANLATLVTRARMERPRGYPAVPLDVVARHTAGVYALTGCPRGWVPALVAAGDIDGARRAAGTLADIFGGRLAIECWDHALPEERALVRHLVPLARAVGAPWVVTNDVHYAEPGGRIVHDVLCCLRHERTLATMGTRLRPNGEWYLKGAAHMRRRWRHDDSGLRATLAIAERCTFRLDLLRPTLPSFPLPPGVTADEYLARLVERGAWERLGIRRPHSREESPTPGSDTPREPHAAPRPYLDQIDHELALIRRLGLAGYFLIVWDIVRFAAREGILCQGRGSAANSVVCYCLGITAVDPVRMELLFERFLSDERHETPDIDLDIAHRERERVLQYVYERYGRAHAAMVCEQISYRGRSAVRDAARVLGLSAEQGEELRLLADRYSARETAERLRDATGGPARTGASTGAPADGPGLADVLGTGMVSGTEATTRARAVTADARRIAAAVHDAHHATAAAAARGPARGGPPDEHATAGGAERPHPRSARHIDSPRAASPLATLALIVDGLHQLPRHRSIHVGGFVLTGEPLSSVVPIEPAAMSGRTVVQWEKDDLDPVGLVKIDLLGLGMLTVLQDCLTFVRRARGVTLDLGQLDTTDQAVYDDLCRGDTIGVFQVESRAQMNTLPRVRPRCFYDLVIEVALIRPGPIQGDMVHPYLRRRAGLEPVTYPHPSLEPILARTLGVPLFQEQGMRVAVAAAGFTPGEADMLRRAMGHKRSREQMAAICERLVHGMTANGIDQATAQQIYEQINAFADYGFPESHAASFALLVYASAYLRHYYPAEYLAAMLNAQPMGFYSVGTLVEDARRHGVEVRPVDLTRSEWNCTLEGRPDRAPSAEPTHTRATTARSNDDAPAVDRTYLRSRGGPPASSVRLGLRLVHGLGARARERLEQARAAGAFLSIEEVVQRTRLDRRTLRLLAEAGAFDAMVPDAPPAQRRRAALWRVLAVLRGDAGPLAPAAGPPVLHPTPLAPLSQPEITEADYRLTGLSLNGHPMRHLRELLQPNGVRTAHELTRARDGERVAAAGLVICRQRPGTAKGFVFLSLEDETGIVNVVVTPRRFEREALLLTTAPLLLVRGTLQVEHGVVNLRGESFRPLRTTGGAEWARLHDFH